MPKEQVHWFIAGEVAAALAEGPWAPAVQAFPEALLLGAVFHDVLFYHRGPGPAGLSQLAAWLHGSRGEDTFALPRLQWRHARRRRAETGAATPAEAALVGVVSHVMADSTLHPLIFYLAGHTNGATAAARSRAVRAHRQLESALDLALCGGLEAVRGRSLLALLSPGARGLGAWLDEVFCLAGLAGIGGLSGPGLRGALVRAWRCFGAMQWLARRPGLSGALFALERRLDGVLPGWAREIMALHYAPQLADHAAWLRGPLTWRHPVTGEVASVRVAELMSLAVARTVALLGELDPTTPGFEAGDEAVEVLAGPGPSLETGLPGVGSERMRFEAGEALPWARVGVTA